MSKFKVGDIVKFVFKSTSSNYDPPLNTLHKIIDICYLNEEYPYKWNPKNLEARFGEHEIELSNSELVKERLGIK